ncbi:acyl-CoA desaturase [Lignipirellula cremea]|nr:fatty acid desaturase [Lignipirellula cremea]
MSSDAIAPAAATKADAAADAPSLAAETPLAPSAASVADSPDAPASKEAHRGGDPLKRLERPKTVSRQIFWTYVAGFVILHMLALLAFVPYFFSWTGVVSIFIGNYIFGSLGINLGYHRLLTHRGLTVPKWLEYTLALCGMCCLQDAPARWVAIHRMHHQHSDDQPDPHSPLVTFFWGHIGWLIYQNKYFGTTDFYDRYARDLLKDPFYLRLERNGMFGWVYLAHAALFYLVGFLVGWAMSGNVAGGVQFGSSMLVWGVFVRTVYVWHITWAVNSVAHCWGYRNYDVSDESRNNWLIGFTNNGEGWHNNHHAHPRCAAHGHKWWEIDLTYTFIVFLEKVGLAKNVVHHTPAKKS